MEQKRGTKDKIYATGIKGFLPGLVCEPDSKYRKQYAENTVFEEPGGEICGPGVMHAADTAADVLDYVHLIDRDGVLSEFARVEALAPVQREGTKWATTKMRIGKKMSFEEFVKAYVDDLEKAVTNAKRSRKKRAIVSYKKEATISSSGYRALISSSGYRAQIISSGDASLTRSSGDLAQIGSSGSWAIIASSGKETQVASSGDMTRVGSSNVNARICTSGWGAQIASSGNRAQIATTGDASLIASSGEQAHINSSGLGSRIASSGLGSRIASSGNEAHIVSKGKDAVISALGWNSTVSAELGSWITLAEYAENGDCLCVKSAKIDGINLKPGISYKLKNGEFKEVK